MSIRKFSVLCAGMSLVAATAAVPARAADWPAKPVTILAPFAAGGTVDLVARVLAVKLGRELGQPFVVDNRGGAGGTIATAMLARAAPDGYTVMIHHMGLVFSDSLYSHLPYDTRRDILPVAYIGATPNVLVVTKTLPVKTMDDFLALAKARPGSINYGSGGIGSAGHLPMAVLGMMTGVKLQHVPYKGSGPALTELVSGQIQSMLLTIPAVMPFIASDMVRPIATSGKKRSPALPNLPTMEEAGIKGFEYAPWYGFFAPAGTPPAVVQKLHEAVGKVLRDPEVVAKLSREGIEVEAMSRERFAGIVEADTQRWGKTIRQLGIKAQ
ncbi:Bug family tripartite tricarboxylate transporter substrate binding protein [Cupriavidus sp. 2TAF22]|uniref:Bug family tripartite tricarboxylate transporter substrate binding protein n=1 Tax=unclassified Cupriavidus TaxID=2640874 RepID=UPI003F8DE34E